MLYYCHKYLFKNGFSYYYYYLYLNIKNESNEKWFSAPVRYLEQFRCHTFSASNLMKLTFFKGLEQKVLKTHGASLTFSQY